MTRKAQSHRPAATLKLANFGTRTTQAIFGSRWSRSTSRSICNRKRSTMQSNRIYLRDCERWLPLAVSRRNADPSVAARESCASSGLTCVEIPVATLKFSKRMKRLSEGSAPLCFEHDEPMQWGETEFTYGEDGVEVVVRHIPAWVCPHSDDAVIEPGMLDELVATVRQFIQAANNG